MPTLREFRLEISYLILAIGAFFTLMVIFHFFLRDVLPSALLDLVDAFGGWIFWLVVIGPLMVLIGGWYFLDTMRKRREFERLIDVPSKARFIRNQSRLEELTWYLPADYNRRYVERKKAWGLRG